MATDLRLRARLPELIDRLVETYSDLNGISHLGHCPLPSHEGVVAMVEAFKEVLYPGYRRRDGLHLANVGFYVGELVDFLHDKLTEQIGRALSTSPKLGTPATGRGAIGPSSRQRAK